MRATIFNRGKGPRGVWLNSARPITLAPGAIRTVEFEKPGLLLDVARSPDVAVFSPDDDEALPPADRKDYSREIIAQNAPGEPAKPEPKPIPSTADAEADALAARSQAEIDLDHAKALSREKREDETDEEHAARLALLDHDGDGKAGGSVDTTSPAAFDEMTDEELRAFITDRDKKAPHANTGREKLLARARKTDGEEG